MTDTLKPTLLACPFCGGEAYVAGDYISIACRDCGAEMHNDVDDCLTSWNTRSPSSDREALIEALERLERIMRENIHENDGPDRIWIDGVAHEGPVASWAIRCFRKVGEIARTALLSKEGESADA